jgi:hypothetical protein
MKHRFIVFSVDTWRFTPLVAISLAVVVNLANLRNVLEGNLSAAEGLGRFAVAFVLSLVGVGGISRLLTSYGRQLVASDAEQGDDAPGGAQAGT